MDTMKGKCGTCCNTCGFKEKFHCGGCGNMNGHVFWGDCDIYKCAADQHCDHCGECDRFPCPDLLEYIKNGHNPDRLSNLEKWRLESQKKSGA